MRIVLYLSAKALILFYTFGALAETPTPAPSPDPDVEEAVVTVTLKGVVLERGTRRPLSGVNVYVLPSQKKGTTDENGKFQIEGVPEGEIEWRINLPGYEPFIKYDRQYAESLKERTWYIKKLSYDLYETTVFDKEEKRDSRSRSLRPSDFTKSPGSGGDPLKAVQNLPGVARPPAFSSQIIIEGSAPENTKFLLDGHEIPLMFHFGGLTSVVFPELLEKIDFHASGYGPEQGRALGGIVGAVIRPGRLDRWHGLAFADFFHAGLLFEVPVWKGSLLLGARRSYIGELLGALLPKSENFDLTVAPGYRDLVGIYDLPIGIAHKFRLLAVGSEDYLKFLRFFRLSYG